MDFQFSIILLHSLSLAHSVIKWSQFENWKCFFPMKKSHWSPPDEGWQIPFLSWLLGILIRNKHKIVAIIIKLQNVRSFPNERYGEECHAYYMSNAIAILMYHLDISNNTLYPWYKGESYISYLKEELFSLLNILFIVNTTEVTRQRLGLNAVPARKM